MRHFFLIELVVNVQGWWLKPPQPLRKPEMNMGGFWRQMALTEAVLAVLGLWLTGAFRPLSAL